MHQDVHAILGPLLKDVFPRSQFKYMFHTEWASANPKHRSLIRQSLYEHFHDPSMLDLAQLPRMHRGYTSVSHCPVMGGWVASKTPVGVDIEDGARDLSARATQRLGTRREVMASPNELALWVAKEASFKALQGEHQPKVISQIEVENWVQRPSHSGLVFMFLFNNFNNINHCGQGLVLIQQRFTLGISIKTP